MNDTYLQHISLQPPQEVRLQEIMQLLNLLRRAGKEQCLSWETTRSVCITSLSNLTYTWLTYHKEYMKDWRHRALTNTHTSTIPDLPSTHPQTHLETLLGSCNKQIRRYKTSHGKHYPVVLNPVRHCVHMTMAGQSTMSSSGWPEVLGTEEV